MTVRFAWQVGLAWITGSAGCAAGLLNAEAARPFPHSPFYAKTLSCAGVPVRASEVVSDDALRVACAKVVRMLMYMPIVQRNLLEWGAELHIIGKSQPTSTLPELHHFVAEAYVDAAGRSTDLDHRARGVGGLFASCSEENLLGLASDRHHDGSDICAHEFAHTIMDVGLDPELRRAIYDQYHRAIQGGLWRGAYASTNAREYWADLSMWYFGSHGSWPPDRAIMSSGPSALRLYDPQGYALLDRVYTGQVEPVAAEVADVEAAGGDEASRNGGGDEARLVLLNTNPLPLSLSWVDDSGVSRGRYPAVNPFQPVVQDSLVGHVWQLTDQKGEEVMRFRLTTIDSRLVVGKIPG